MRCLLVVAVVLAIGVGAVPPHADATQVSELHACWAMTATARRCYDDVAVATEAGGWVDE